MKLTQIRVKAQTKVMEMPTLWWMIVHGSFKLHPHSSMAIALDEHEEPRKIHNKLSFLKSSIEEFWISSYPDRFIISFSGPFT